MEPVVVLDLAGERALAMMNGGGLFAVDVERLELVDPLPRSIDEALTRACEAEEQWRLDRDRLP